MNITDIYASIVLGGIVIGILLFLGIMYFTGEKR